MKYKSVEEMNELAKLFEVDTWVLHVPTDTVSRVFIGYAGTIEPFVQIGDFDKNNYKKLTENEAVLHGGEA